MERGIWHRMGDLGYFDSEDGCGSAAEGHRVQIGSNASSPSQRGTLQHPPQVFRTALVGPTRGDGKRVAALCVEFEDGLSRSEQMKTWELRDIQDTR